MTAGRYDFAIGLLHRGIATIPLDRLDDLDPDFEEELRAYIQADADLSRQRTP